jgi:hypothetical protein
LGYCAYSKWDASQSRNQRKKTANMKNNASIRNLGPLDETPCKTCGRRHHLYAWPKKCYEAAEHADYASELAHDRKSYAQMSQVERDAHDNL